LAIRVHITKFYVFLILACISTFGPIWATLFLAASLSCRPRRFRRKPCYRVFNYLIPESARNSELTKGCLCPILRHPLRFLQTATITTTGKYVRTLDQIEKIAVHSKKKILGNELLNKIKTTVDQWHVCATTRLANFVRKYMRFRR